VSGSLASESYRDGWVPATGGMGQERIYVMRDDPAAYDQVSTPSNRRPNSVSTAGGHGSTRS
jgi:hypothetical protein